MSEKWFSRKCWCRSFCLEIENQFLFFFSNGFPFHRCFGSLLQNNFTSHIAEDNIFCKDDVWSLIVRWENDKKYYLENEFFAIFRHSDLALLIWSFDQQKVSRYGPGWNRMFWHFSDVWSCKINMWTLFRTYGYSKCSEVSYLSFPIPFGFFGFHITVLEPWYYDFFTFFTIPWVKKCIWERRKRQSECQKSWKSKNGVYRRWMNPKSPWIQCKY